MDLQTVTTTQVQRGFGKILDTLDEPVLVMRDSMPEAVVMPYDDYRVLVNRKKRDDWLEIKKMLAGIHKRNAHIPDEEVNRDIEEALAYVRGSHRH